MIGLSRYILAMGILAATVLPARATDVSARLSAGETYVGVPVTLRISVEDGQPEQTPIVPAVKGGIDSSGGRAVPQFAGHADQWPAHAKYQRGL